MRSSFVRYVLAGGVNTLLTSLLLSWLATLINPILAYVVAFAGGIALSLYLAGSFVFRSRITPRRAASYIALYLGVFLTGLLALYVALRAGLPPSWSGVVVVITATLGFLGGRAIFADEKEEPLDVCSPQGDM
jgi:putative flippase GtrA